MEFCQALTSQGTMFSFTLSTGNGFSFSLDTKESEKPASAVAEQAKKKKKKLSPSDVRRNQRRRQEFLKRKSEGRDDDLTLLCCKLMKRPVLKIRLLIFSFHQRNAIVFAGQQGGDLRELLGPLFC